MSIFTRKGNLGRKVNNSPGGSSSSFSYYAGNSSSNSLGDNKTKQREVNKDSKTDNDSSNPRAIGKISLIIIILFILFIAGDTIWLNSTAKIVILNNNLNKSITLKPNIYADKVNKALSSSLLNHTKVSINTIKIEDVLKNQFPELSSASVVLPILGHTPAIYLQITQPAVLLKNDNKIFVLDSGGKAITDSTKAETQFLSTLPVVQDQTNSNIILNKQVLSTNDINFVRFVAEQLSFKKITISYQTLLVNTRELDVGISNPSYFIKFNLEEDVREQVGSFLATRDSLKKSNVIPTSYMDVRVQGKVYYK
jgi:hypothetical protein